MNNFHRKPSKNLFPSDERYADYWKSTTTYITQSASGQRHKIKKALAKGKKYNEQQRRRRLTFTDIDNRCLPIEHCPVKTEGKEQKKRKVADNNITNQLKQDSPQTFKNAKTTSDASKDWAICSKILSEMENHQDAWPFLLPVNLKHVPGYKKVIKKPMDFSTIREKLSNGQYTNVEAFSLDIRLVFRNCDIFNDDDSDIGKAGHHMKIFFEKKWTTMFKVS